MSAGWAIAAIFVRMAGAVTTAPLGEGLGGAFRRFSIAGGLTLLAAAERGVAPVEPAVPELLLEFALGAAIGFPPALAVECSVMLGELFDAGRGQTLGSFLDPVNSVQQSPAAHLARAYSTALILASGALPLLVASVFDSLRTLPPGTLAASRLAELGASTAELLSIGLAGAFLMFVPFAAVFGAVELVIGYLGRMVPNFTAGAEGLLLRSAFGAAMLYAFHGTVAEKLMPLARAIAGGSTHG